MDRALQALSRGGALLLHHQLAYLRPGEVAQALEAVLPSPPRSPGEAAARLETAKQQVARLEEAEVRARASARRKARLVAWGGFALLVGQWGFLFRLTFYELSWDVMASAIQGL